jgi:hypothetical protein
MDIFGVVPKDFWKKLFTISPILAGEVYQTEIHPLRFLKKSANLSVEDPKKGLENQRLRVNAGAKDAHLSFLDPVFLHYLASCVRAAISRL